VISACAERTDIAKVEKTALRSVDPSIGEVNNVLEFKTVQQLNKAMMRTGDAYLTLADNVATAESGAGLLVLGLATAGAGILLTGGSTSALEYVGLSAFALQQGRNYLNPTDTAKALTAAAESSFCIASSSLQFAEPSDGNGDKSFHLIANALLQNKIQLRNKLTRGAFPDYSTLIKSAQDAQSNIVNKTPDTATMKAGSTKTSDNNLEFLVSALADCKLKA